MKRALRMILIVLVLAIAGASIYIATQVTLAMPGKNFDGARPALTPAEQQVSAQLKADVVKLASEIGHRNSIETPDKLEETAKYIESQFAAAGFTPMRQDIPIDTSVIINRKTGEQKPVKGTFANVEAELTGTTKAGEIIVIGGHYDSVIGSPGADDNATGVAAVLALARAFGGKKSERTVRFVGFFNEEPPFWHQPTLMGSRKYAERCRERKENVVAMMSLETMGYFSDKPESQHYPFPLSLIYPSTANFLAFVGNLPSVPSMKRTVEAFRRVAKVPSYGAAAKIQSMSFSDHRSFWQVGYPGFMVTDTAFFRNDNYHEMSDVPETLDYDRLAQVMTGLVESVMDLAGVDRPAVKL